MSWMESGSTCRVIPVADRKHVNALDSVRVGLTVTICLWNGTIWTVNSLFICIELFMLYTLIFYEGIFDWISNRSIVCLISKRALSVFLVHQVVINYVYHFLGEYGIDVQKYSVETFLLIVFLTALVCVVYEKCNNAVRSRKKKR